MEKLPAQQRPQVLRHTFCSRLAVLLVGARPIHEFAGHRNLSMTHATPLSPGVKSTIELLDCVTGRAGYWRYCEDEMIADGQVNGQTG